MEQTKIQNKKLNLEEKRYKAWKVSNLLNEHFNVDCSILRRTNNIVIPRQIAIYFIDKYIPMVDAEIGKLFVRENGNPLNHATIIHAKNKVADLIRFDKETRKIVKELEGQVKELAKYTDIELIKFKLKEDILNEISNYNVLGLKNLRQNLVIMPEYAL